MQRPRPLLPCITCGCYAPSSNAALPNTYSLKWRPAKYILPESPLTQPGEGTMPGARCQGQLSKPRSPSQADSQGKAGRAFSNLHRLLPCQGQLPNPEAPTAQNSK
jgi:hypothetical protein